jgi:hypothetical protein
VAIPADLAGTLASDRRGVIGCIELRRDLVEQLDVVVDQLPLMAALLRLAEHVQRSAAQAF